MEGLKVANANLVVYVHPSKSKNVTQTIFGELSSMLFKYNETFDGVLLAYDANFSDKHAKILPGVHPYFGVKLNASLVLFSPKPSMLVEGKVMKVTQELIHIVVLGFSSAVITDVDIREEFKFKIKDRQERFVSRSHKSHVIKVGSTIRFLVNSFDDEMLHLYGSLIPAETGCVKWLDKNLHDGSRSDWNSKKWRDAGGETKTMDHETITDGTSSLTNSNESKKFKKRKVADNH